MVLGNPYEKVIQPPQVENHWPRETQDTEFLRIISFIKEFKEF